MMTRRPSVRGMRIERIGNLLRNLAVGTGDTEHAPIGIDKHRAAAWLEHAMHLARRRGLLEGCIGRRAPLARLFDHRVAGVDAGDGSVRTNYIA